MLVTSSVNSPATMPEPTSTKCRTTRAKGIEQINYLVLPAEKARLKQYCKRRGISMTDFIKQCVAKGLAESGTNS
jgi:hypothetical protein